MRYNADSDSDADVNDNANVNADANADSDADVADHFDEVEDIFFMLITQKDAKK